MLPWPGARGARGLGQDGDVPAAPKASPGMGQWGWSRAVTEAVTFLTGPAGRSSQWTEAEGHWAGSQASGGRALRLPTSPPAPHSRSGRHTPILRARRPRCAQASWGFCLTQWAGLCGEARGHPLLFLLRHTLPAALTLPRRREAGFQRNFLGAPHPPPPSQTDQPQRLGWD